MPSRTLTADDIYNALSFAETGGEQNPWIRTRLIPEGGSSAFGPVQITLGIIKDAINRGKLSKESLKFAQDIMLPMQGQFLKYGNTPNLAEKFKPYDYGGTGNFNVRAYETAYRQLANELINLKLEGVKGNNINQFLKSWRGKEPEKDYLNRFMSKYKVSHYKR